MIKMLRLLLRMFSLGRAIRSPRNAARYAKRVAAIKVAKKAGFF